MGADTYRIVIIISKECNMLPWFMQIILIFISLVWAIIGFIFWIPFLGRMIAVFVISILSSVSNGSCTISAKNGLRLAISFYIDGFHKIWSVEDTDKTDIPGNNQPGGMKLFLNYVETLFFWTVFLLMCGFIQVPSIDEIAAFFSIKGAVTNESLINICLLLFLILVILLTIFIVKRSFSSKSKK